MKLSIRRRWIHAHDKLAGHLRCDHIIGNAVYDLAVVQIGGNEIEKRVVDTVEILSVLTRVVETAFGDLGELTGPVEAGWSERVGGRGVDVPVDLC